MTVLTWQKSFSVGVKELDKQHKRLLELINEIPDLEEKKAYETLNQLIRYADTHFNTEEMLMKEHKYPGLDRQRKEHEKFTNKIFEINEGLNNKQTETLNSIKDYIMNWYISHILGMDQEYSEFFKNAGIE